MDLLAHRRLQVAIVGDAPREGQPDRVRQGDDGAKGGEAHLELQPLPQTVREWHTVEKATRALGRRRRVARLFVLPLLPLLRWLQRLRRL